MSSLAQTTPCDGLLPIRHGALTLAEAEFWQMTAISPLSGQRKAVSAALKAAHGVGLPAAGRSTSRGGVRCLWAGLDHAMLIGAAPGKLAGAVLVDQSDAWAVIELSGIGAGETLARLTPLDLRASTFKNGHTARSVLGHLPAQITRIGGVSFEIMVFRSMARSAVHELERAMRTIAAQA